ncbi:cobalamin-dependent protein [Candidatus Bathyarchaeota archaeon]|nr:cobalamin-dependent protein [Candidatus Bathyarchaeota archaeon]
MPLGTLALADFLDRHGYSTRIIHTGIEQLQNRSFKIEDIFKEYSPTVVGIDLHWFVHSYDAVRIAETVKEYSSAKVVLGGFTASYFAEEILSRFNSVDAVIKGDAEEPLIQFMRERDRDLQEVPNLVYKEENIIKKSEKRFIADEAFLSKLDYTRFELLLNCENYFRLTTQTGDLDPQPWKVRVKRHAWVPMGRGCSVNCSYCGGGLDAQCLITGRNKPIFHPKEKVVETLRRFMEMRIDSTYMDFDPYRDRRHHLELFEMIRKEKIDISSEFLLWSPSNRGFITEFAKTFNPLYSSLVISPESGSEEVRQKNKGFCYDNKTLFDWLNDAKRESVPVKVFFSSGLSWETKENFNETIKLGKTILENYPVIEMVSNPLVMEPASKRYLNPEMFGVKLKWKSFMDYYGRFKRLAEGIPEDSRIGYETSWESEREIIENSIRFNKMVSST